jgi:tRNA A-37 threonylcarbamoyl transferase component Bud32
VSETEIGSDATTLDRRGVQWWIAPGRNRDDCARALDAALEAVDGDQEPEVNGRRKTRYRLALDGGRPDHLLKVTHYDRGSAWSSRLRRSKARREFDVAHALSSRGIETPLPIAAGECRRRGFLQRSFLLLPFEAESVDLSDFERAAEVSPRQRNRVAAGLGDLARQLHDAGLLQPDFAPNNFLLRGHEPPEIVPIDFERAELVRGSGGVDTRQRLDMLAKLERHLPRTTPACRMRFLAAYAGDSARARSLWRDVANAVPALVAHDVERMSRVASSDGRRFRSAEFEGWSGWARRDSERFDVACELLTREKTRSEPPLRIESRGGAWALAYRERQEPDAKTVWAIAQVLWNRRLVPRPICALRRDRDFRIYFERDTEARPGSGAAARAAATVLVGRLLGLGSLSPDFQRDSLHVRIASDGRPVAELIDVALFSTGGALPDRARSRARRLCDTLRI